MRLARIESGAGRPRNAYDVFVALDDGGRRIGKCTVISYQADSLLPDCPYNIYLDLDGQLGCMDMLLGAALARCFRRAEEPRFALCGAALLAYAAMAFFSIATPITAPFVWLLLALASGR